jgi:4-hydroxy-3-methylbut-2-enyl diphosphate reductase
VELARTADLVVVVGGSHSANTRRLAELCREIQPRTVQVETAEELVQGVLERVRRVVVTGGASTPGGLLRQVADRLEHLARTIHHGEMSQAG